MAVFSLQRLRDTGDPAAAIMTDAESEAMAEHLEQMLLRDRVRYDHRAAELRQYGVDPAEILGPRP